MLLDKHWYVVKNAQKLWEKNCNELAETTSNGLNSKMQVYQQIYQQF